MGSDASFNNNEGVLAMLSAGGEEGTSGGVVGGDRIFLQGFTPSRPYLPPGLTHFSSMGGAVFVGSSPSRFPGGLSGAEGGQVG